VGPRLLVVPGLVLTVVGTLAFALAGPAPSDWLLAASLVVRGAGLGAATIAVMANAFQGVPHQDVPDASTTMRIVQQVGGSFGAAVLAVILATQLASHAVLTAAIRVAAFDTAFWWAIGFTVLAVAPAVLLPTRLRRHRTGLARVPPEAIPSGSDSGRAATSRQPTTSSNESRDDGVMSWNSRRLLLPAGMLYLVGALEGVEVLRQRRRGLTRSLVTSSSDRDPASVRLLALTWWPAGIVALATAASLPQFGIDQRRTKRCQVGGLAVTGLGVALRQWAITTLGPFFVGHVLVQPGQTVVSSGPYRWLRHPSYTGQWLEMIGIGLATGNVLSMATCALLPLVGITARIEGEERELTTALSGYGDYSRGRSRLVPLIW
jgi:protein-S-isoprenylcysteine O-methyltransferase Ste14